MVKTCLSGFSYCKVMIFVVGLILFVIGNVMTMCLRAKFGIVLKIKNSRDIFISERTHLNSSLWLIKFRIFDLK